MMTLKEAIKHCKEIALSCDNKKCALEHFQLFKWLEEYQNLLEKQGEQKPADKIEPSAFKDKLLELFQKFRYIKEGVPTNGDIIDYVDAHIQELIDTVQNKPWSEEDYNMLDELLDYCEHSIAYNGKGTLQANVWEQRKNWLKSLKDRVQPKQEWSEEDRRHIEKLILNVNAKECPDEVNWLISLHEKIAPPYWDKEDEEMLNQAIQEVEYALNDKNIAFSGREPVLLWLKHLRPKSHWKPSETELRVFEEIIDGIANPCNYHATLHAMLEQLKKLMEE